MTSSLDSIISRLHARNLRLLVALDEHGTLLGAAKQVSMTQPGASKALKEIESIFGVDLFNRTNRGLEANELGHCVIRYARLIQTDLAHLRQELVGIARGDGGRVCVGVIMGAVPRLTEAVSDLVSLHPEMSVEIVEDTSLALLSQLDAGRLDLCICRTTVSKNPEMYTSSLLQSETLAVITGKNNILSGVHHLDLADLISSKWIVYRANMPMRNLLEREFLHAGLKFPTHLVETTSAFATLTLLRRNPAFVALVSTDVAKILIEHGGISMLPIQLSERSEPYELVVRKTQPTSPGAKLLITQILKNNAVTAESDL